MHFAARRMERPRAKPVDTMFIRGNRPIIERASCSTAFILIHTRSQKIIQRCGALW